jgi:hypothetical protein
MSILDGLFSQAAADYKPSGSFSATTVSATVTTNRISAAVTPNQGSVSTADTNAAKAYTMALSYAPAGFSETTIDGVKLQHPYPAQFSGSSGGASLVIRGLNIGEPSYTVGWDGGNFFDAQVDPTTNVVFCTVNSNYITIGLCGYAKGQPVPM